MEDIKGYTSFGRIEPVTQGWSGDRKYYIETHQGEKLFLRLADIAYYSSKRHEFEMLRKWQPLALPTPKPVDLVSASRQSVYSLFTWCEGEDAELVLERLTAQEQYALGVQIGEYLRQIHSLPAPATAENWESRFGRKARAKIEAYAACPVKFPGDQYLIDYLQANWRLLKNRPQSFQHGGFHGGNMVIARDGKISLIDFNRCDYGDPWEEFNRIAFSVKASAEFASGQFHGYFGESLLSCSSSCWPFTWPAMPWQPYLGPSLLAKRMSPTCWIWPGMFWCGLTTCKTPFPRGINPV